MANRALPRPLIVATLAVFCAAVATPCSFDTTPALFHALRPDFPIDDYVDGKLGVLQPTYARSHLVVAYRYLSGHPPSAAEREAFRDLLRHRLNEYPEGARSADPVEQWERLRTTTRGIAYQSRPDPDRAGVDAYDYYTNCTDDAFATASATLASRVKTFGATHPDVTSWLDAQETVFANCSGGETRIPSDDATLPDVLRADRRYQIAAAHFYALDYGEARAQFLAIARDRSSPWQKTARLVATRVLIRAQSLNVPIDEADPLALADKELRAILEDPSMKSLHDAAWDLLAVTTFRRDPQERLRDAVKGITGSETSARRVRAHLADYTLLLDKDVRGDDELTDWITAFQSGNLAHAIDRWKATKKTHWLAAALAHVKADDPAVASLLEASSSSSDTTIVHHRVRLLLAADRDDEARAALDRTLARDLPASARNQLLTQRRSVARTLADFLRDTPAKPVAEGEDSVDPRTAPAALPPDAAYVLNHWAPLKTLQVAARDEKLPGEIGGPLQRAVTTRADLLGNPTFETAYRLAQNTDEKPYVDALDGDWQNWWCKGGSNGDVPAVPPFLVATLDAANAENDKLAVLGSGATFTLRTVIARAKSHPNDERVPEALSLAILATKRACGDGDTEKLAKEAFGVLHRKYGKTKWAEETPYWYRPY